MVATSGLYSETNKMKLKYIGLASLIGLSGCATASSVLQNHLQKFNEMYECKEIEIESERFAGMFNKFEGNLRDASDKKIEIFPGYTTKLRLGEPVGLELSAFYPKKKCYEIIPQIAYGFILKKLQKMDADGNKQISRSELEAYQRQKHQNDDNSIID